MKSVARKEKEPTSNNVVAFPARSATPLDTEPLDINLFLVERSPGCELAIWQNPDGNLRVEDNRTGELIWMIVNVKGGVL